MKLPQPCDGRPPAHEQVDATAPGARRVYLVRHAAPTLPDGQRRFLGLTDLPLSAEGVRQAHALADRLRECGVSAIYCSGLARSRHTATILAEGRRLVPQERHWLREIDTGSWDLLSFEEVSRLYPQEWAARESDLADTPFPGGESLREVQKRVVPGFFDLLDEREGDMLIVGHRAVNVVLLASLTDKPLALAFTIPQDYCALNVIEVSIEATGCRRFSVRPGQ